MKVLWVARASKEMRQGYARIGWKFPVFLDKAGVELLPWDVWGWDWRVLCGLPETWYLPEGQVQEDLCIHTMFETRPLPERWARILNHAGLVWVPSQWCADVFRESGVTRPIMVSGYGVDPEEYGYIERERSAEDPYTFLAIDFSIFGRKNMMRTLGAFCDIKAGMPDVPMRLVMKTNVNLGPPLAWDKEDVAEDLDLELSFRRGESGPMPVNYHGEPMRGIYIVQGAISTFEMARLFRIADCFVHPTGGEGFGLPALEAMATGLPVITSAWSGQMEYLRDDVALSVPVTAPGNRQDPKNPFAAPDLGAMKDHMLWCLTHREEAAEIGRRASAYVMSEWTWELAGERARDQLEEHLEKRCS